MKPITIKFREDDFNTAIEKYNRCAGFLQHYIDQITTINGLKITPELFTDIVSGNGDLADAAISSITESELQKAKINSQSLKHQAVKADREKFYEIFNNLHADPEIGGMKYKLAIEGGKVVLPEATKAQIKQEFTIQVTTDKGKNLYEAQKEMITAMNKFVQLLGERPDILRQSFSLPAYGSKEVHPQILAYDLI